MSLTAGANYADRARTNASGEVYLLTFQDSEDYVSLHLGQTDCTFGADRYFGLIVNQPQVREVIDLAECTAKISNVTVVCANQRIPKIGNRLLSDILKNGNEETPTGLYISWPVRLYSWLGPETDADNLTKVFEGRLVAVKVNEGSAEVVLTLEQKLPWDLISIPEERIGSGQYVPVVYGDYAHNTSVIDSQSYCTSMSLWPAKVVDYGASKLRALAFEDASGSLRLHSYERSIDQFVPISDSAGDFIDSTLETDDGFVIEADSGLYMGIKAKGVYKDQTSDGRNMFSNPERAYDVKRADDGSTVSLCGVTINDSIGGGYYAGYGYILLDIPSTSVPFDGDIDVEIYYYIQRTYPAHSISVAIRVYDDGGLLDQDTCSLDTADTMTLTIPAGSNMAELYLMVYGLYTGGSAFIARFADVRVIGNVQMPSDADDQARLKTLKDYETLYCGGDGLTRSWDSGACQSINEVHRDILYRFAGITAAPTNWAGLDSKLTTWYCRMWLHEPTPVAEVLAKLQFEGGFIFRLDAVGTPKYIFVPSSYSGGDVTYTVDASQEIGPITFSHTPTSDLVTKYVVDFQPHPADDSRYLQQETATSASRDDYSFESIENIESVKLDWLASTDGTTSDTVVGWTDYRETVLGAVKQEIEFEVLHKRLWLAEVGDILKFVTPPIDPFADLTTIYWMIVSTRRSPGRLTITAREVG